MREGGGGAGREGGRERFRERKFKGEIESAGVCRPQARCVCRRPSLAIRTARCTCRCLGDPPPSRAPAAVYLHRRCCRFSSPSLSLPLPPPPPSASTLVLRTSIFFSSSSSSLSSSFPPLSLAVDYFSSSPPPYPSLFLLSPPSLSSSFQSVSSPSLPPPFVISLGRPRDDVGRPGPGRSACGRPAPTSSDSCSRCAPLRAGRDPAARRDDPGGPPEVSASRKIRGDPPETSAGRTSLPGSPAGRRYGPGDPSRPRQAGESEEFPGDLGGQGIAEMPRWPPWPPWPA